jgi:hypothetical protein
MAGRTKGIFQMRDKRKFIAAAILMGMGCCVGGCEWMSDYPKSPYSTPAGVQYKSGPGSYGGTNIPDKSNNVLPAEGAQPNAPATQ